MGHVPQVEVFMCEESQDTHYYNDVQEGENECVSNECIVYAIVSQDAKEEHEEDKDHIQTGCPFDEDFFKDVKAEDNQKWDKLYHDGCSFKLITSMKKIFKGIRPLVTVQVQEDFPAANVLNWPMEELLINTTFLSQET